MLPPPQGGPSAISLLVADPHPIVRVGVKAMLRDHSDLRVCGEAGSGPEAVALARAHHPDVVVTEARCPEMDGPELVTGLRAACPSLKIVVLTGRPERASMRALLAAGVAGYALKRTDASRLVQAVRAVAGGETYLDPEVAGWVVDGFLERTDAASRGAELSEREVQVLRMIALGYSNKEISAKLALSVKTVETYKARSLEKLGVRSRVAVVRYAIEQGWLADPATAISELQSS